MESFRYGLGASDMGRDCGVVADIIIKRLAEAKK